MVIAECKAHAEKIGGAELNKFYAALTRERKNHRAGSVAGYFVSLGGFTETGIDQENETGDDKVILVDARKTIQELQRCHVIVPPTIAAEQAGQCALHNGLQHAELTSLELFGHGSGYLWAAFYQHAKSLREVACQSCRR